MQNGSWILFFAGSVLLILTLIVFYKDKNSKDKRENYDFLGQLAPNKLAYAECISECERQDPTSRLGPGNPNCAKRCEILYSEAAKRGIRVIPDGGNIGICRQKCAHPNPEVRDKCVNRCSCHREVADYCDRIECPHSSNHDECMKGCIAREIVNCDRLSGWTWKKL